MKTAAKRYHEASLMERMMPPLGKLVAWADARFLVVWKSILSHLDRFVERGAVTGGMFIIAMLCGWAFVVKTVSARPELNFTQADTFKVGMALSLAIGTLRFLCAHNVKGLKGLPPAAAREGISYLQPFRPSAAATLIGIGSYATLKIGAFSSGAWYLDGYFYLCLTCLFSLFGLYAHSASIYLMITDRIHLQNVQKAREIAGATIE